MKDFQQFIGHERVDETVQQIYTVLLFEPERLWFLSELAKNVSEPNLNVIRVALWQLIDEVKVDWTSEPDVTLSLLLDTLAKSPRALQLVVYPMSTGEYSVSIEELGLIATEVVTKRLCETLNNDLTLALAQITALALTKLS